MVHIHAEVPTVYAREQTQQIVGEVPALSYEQRYRIVHTSSEGIFRSDRARFITFLQLPLEQSALAEDDLASLKNDVADILLHTSSATDDLAQLFLTQLTDASQGETWQSYVLQKLGPASFKVQDPAMASALIQQLQQIASEPDQDSAAGTALLALDDVAQAGGSIDVDAVALLAVTILEDERYPPYTRGAGMRIGARAGLSSCLDYARTVVAQPGEPFGLYVAAIATLGIAGDSADLSTLNTFSKSGDIRISQAASYAAKRIRARSQQ